MNTETKTEQDIDPRHAQKRSLLRKVGPALLVAGGFFLIIGFVDFARAMSSFGHEPRLFWCFFVAMPLMWLGFVLTSAGFASSVHRYMSAEAAPVAKDTVNYMAAGTKDSVKTLATAVGEGLAAGKAAVLVRCHKCNATNDVDSKFCKSCGVALAKTKPCPACGELNDPDARFCDACGKSVAA